MRDAIRISVLGTGQMGTAIARLVCAKPGLELVGVMARRSSRAGLDVGPLCGLGRELGVAVSDDLPQLLERTRPDLAIQATCSRLDDALPEITTLLDAGVHLISIAEEMAYPAAASPRIAAELHALAVSRGVAALGTGVNPGFVLDLLVVTLSGVCSEIRSITARRVNDLSPYGPAVLASQGVGLSPAAFARGLEEGRVVGHHGFPQSLHMIADALGWSIEEIREDRTPILSRVQRKTPFVEVQAGEVAGCEHTAIAYGDGRALITLIHPQQVHPELEGIETGDFIEIDGRPLVRLSGSPEIAGGEATAALAVNMIPRLLNATPGLHSMADLPAPAAMLADARHFLKDGAETAARRGS